MAHGEGYWISPTGRVITVDRHINAILEKPGTFGLTSEYVKDLYDRHGEHLRSEGKAREELLTTAMNRGWIRVREWQGRRGEWVTIETSRINNKAIDLIQQFAQAYVDGEVPGTHRSKKARGLTEARVFGLHDGFRKSYSMKELANYAMFSHYEKLEAPPLRYLGHQDDLDEEQWESLAPVDTRRAIRTVLETPNRQRIFNFLYRNGIDTAVAQGVVRPASVMKASTMTEASISRLMRHGQEGPGFVVVSSDRPTKEDLMKLGKSEEEAEEKAERTPEENNKFYKKLKNILSAKGLGYVPVHGGYRDKEGVTVFEQAAFIPQVTEEQAMALAKFLAREPWNQESVMYGGPKGVFLIFGDGGRLELGPFRPEHVGDYFTEWRKRRFSYPPLEDTDSEPESQQESLEWWYKDTPTGQLSGLSLIGKIARIEALSQQ